MNLNKLKNEYDVIVVGAGPAGISAAISSASNGLEKILIVDRHKWLGGILQQCIHPGFGLKNFKQELTGPEYAQRYISILKNFKVDVLLDTTINKISRFDQEEWSLSLTNITHGIREIRTKTIIVATGCRERTRGSINIPGDRPSGIYNAGTAQRMINIEGYKIGEKVAILGSGDIGLIMARRCMIEGLKVEAVIEIMPHPTGLNRNVVQCLNDFNIPLFLNHTITLIKGKNRLEKISFAQIDKNKNIIRSTIKNLNCDTLLLSVGLIPEIELLSQVGAKFDIHTNGPVVDNYLQTSVEGIFACGNVVQVFDLVDYVSNDGERAGKSASLYLKGKFKKIENETEIVFDESVTAVVPQKIKIINDINSLTQFLYLRVKRHMKNVTFSFYNKYKKIGFIKKPYAIPSEMIKLNISKLLNEIIKNNKVEVIATGETLN